MQILLIEDDPFFQKFYAGKLAEQGFSVETASDGEEGLQKALAIHPQIILLDLIMPKKDGFEVLTIRKQTPALAQIPVLVFSTLGQEQDVEKAKQLGANDYVNKGLFDVTTLVTKINGLVK